MKKYKKSSVQGQNMTAVDIVRPYKAIFMILGSKKSGFGLGNSTNIVVPRRYISTLKQIVGHQNVFININIYKYLKMKSK